MSLLVAEPKRPEAEPPTVRLPKSNPIKAKGRRHPAVGLAHIILADPLNVIAFALLALILLMALIGPYVVPYDPLHSSALEALQPPSVKHWFGTDDLGRDVFSRVVVAARLDLLISVSAVALSFAAGSVIGTLAGYYGGWFDRISGRLIDTIMAFPLFVLAMGIVSAAGNTVANVVYATAIINLPFYARLVRAEVLVRREAGFVQAARLCGNPDWRILAFHIFPNTLPPLMIQASLNMGWSIMNAAGLSFIGLGVQPPTAEWGILVAQGANFIVSGEWWVALFPGAVLMLAIFTFNLLGDVLRDLVDPLRRV
jgi:peptide/nickel transport system permease protein